MKIKWGRKTLYVFDSFNQAFSVIWAIIGDIENHDEHTYMLENIEVKEDIGFGVYKLSDGVREISFVYHSNKTCKDYQATEPDIKNGSKISIIGSIGDIEDPDSCVMRGVKIEKGIE